MNIGIYSRIFKPEHLGYLKYLVNKLEKNKFNILIHKDYKDQITSSKTIQALQTFQQQTEINTELKERNRVLAAEVYDLKNGIEAIEEHAVNAHAVRANLLFGRKAERVAAGVAPRRARA